MKFFKSISVLHIIGRIYFFVICLLLVACSSSKVVVNRYPIVPEDLPSYYVESPDPEQKNPVIGQLLNCNYKIKNPDKNKMPYFLILKVIYKNLDEETKSIAIFRDEGVFDFPVVGEKYEATGGVLTYKADLTTFDGEEVANFKHRLWFDLISFE